MNFYAGSLIVSVFLLTFWTTSRLARASFSLKFLDHPNDRSLHVRPTPRTGGIAILAGIVAGFLLAPGFDAKTLWILATTLFLGIVSFLDVKSALPPGVRLISHGIATLGIVWGYGLKIHALSVPLLGTVALGSFAVPITLLTLIWMTNLYNFMDGMDGLAGGMTVFGFGFLGLLGWIAGHHSLTLQSWIIAAATAGFLIHNLPPAKIFMGDVGSIPLGFLAGIFILRASDEGVCNLWGPLLIFSPFIVDSTLTLLNRIVKKKRFWLAHREHYYQRIVLGGWRHSKTVLAEYVLILSVGFSALIFEKTSPPLRLGILIGWVAIYAIIAYSVRVLEKNKLS